jgi:hypothetical protein
MHYQFNATDWKRLSSIERAQRCQFLSEEAMMMAEKAVPELRVRYCEFAEAFLRLANDLDVKAQVSRGDPARK